jgi:hypothetical protein
MIVYCPNCGREVGREDLLLRDLRIHRACWEEQKSILVGRLSGQQFQRSPTKGGVRLPAAPQETK